MIRRRGPASALALVLLAGCATATRAPEPPATPERAALELFRIAAEPDATEERLERLFAPETNLARRAELRDALAALVLPEPPAVVDTQALDGPRRVVVDLRAELAGGGEALYSVRVEQDPAEHWTVTWFQGPGVEWPASPGRRDEGRSTSAPPGPLQR